MNKRLSIIFSSFCNISNNSGKHERPDNHMSHIRYRRDSRMNEYYRRSFGDFLCSAKEYRVCFNNGGTQTLFRPYFGRVISFREDKVAKYNCFLLK